MSIGANIRRIREEKGITQVELAEMAGTSQPYLNRIEMEKQVPSAKVIVAAAKAFGCLVDDLLKEDEKYAS